MKTPAFSGDSSSLVLLLRHPPKSPQIRLPVSVLARMSVVVAALGPLGSALPRRQFLLSLLPLARFLRVYFFPQTLLRCSRFYLKYYENGGEEWAGDTAEEKNETKGRSADDRSSTPFQSLLLSCKGNETQKLSGGGTEEEEKERERRKKTEAGAHGREDPLSKTPNGYGQQDSHEDRRREFPFFLSFSQGLPFFSWACYEKRLLGLSFPSTPSICGMDSLFYHAVCTLGGPVSLSCVSLSLSLSLCACGDV